MVYCLFNDMPFESMCAIQPEIGTGEPRRGGAQILFVEPAPPCSRALCVCARARACVRVWCC